MIQQIVCKNLHLKGKSHTQHTLWSQLIASWTKIKMLGDNYLLTIWIGTTSIPWKHISLNSSFPFFALLIYCELSNFIIENQLKVSVAFTERARFSRSVRYPYTPWTVYCLSMHFIRPACQSRYLESKFRFKYILNWWPRSQEPPPPSSCLESWD